MVSCKPQRFTLHMSLLASNCGILKEGLLYAWHLVLFGRVRAQTGCKGCIEWCAGNAVSFSLGAGPLCHVEIAENDRFCVKL